MNTSPTRSALYGDALDGWLCVERRALAEGARERTEVMWIYPACAAWLAAEGRSPQQQLDMLEAAE